MAGLHDNGQVMLLIFIEVILIRNSWYQLLSQMIAIVDDQFVFQQNVPCYDSIQPPAQFDHLTCHLIGRLTVV